MNFPCVKCGQCCRNVGNVEQLKDFDNGSGVCIHLVNNLCGIYDTRPIWCNVERAYHEVFSATMTEDEYITANLKVCRELIAKKDSP